MTENQLLIQTYDLETLKYVLNLYEVGLSGKFVKITGSDVKNSKCDCKDGGFVYGKRQSKFFSFGSGKKLGQKHNFTISLHQKNNRHIHNQFDNFFWGPWEISIWFQWRKHYLHKKSKQKVSNLSGEF